MSIRDVTVTITRETAAVSQAGFGLPLILATSKNQAYTLYTDLQSVAEDFEETTEEYRIANRLFGQNPRPERLAIAGIEYDKDMDSPSDLVSALNGIEGDFYFVVSPEQGDEEITAISEWIDSQKRLYFASTANVDLPGTLESDRTVLMVHQNPRSYPAEGWVGRCAPTDPGSITWKFKTINGVSESGFGITEDIAIREDGGNTYISQGGILMATEGIATSGEYIDIMRSVDFLDARIQEGVFRRLAVTDKIPFTNTGIKLVVAEVESALKQGFNNGIIADDESGNPLYSISAPTRDEVPVNDRANRTLPDVNFEAELAGAVHSVRVTGVVRV